MAKKSDPAKEKAKRQKMIAIVGGVVLLALLAFQVPRTMKMLHSGGTVTTSASTTATSTSAAGSTPLAPPTLDGGSSAAAGSSAAGGGGASVETSKDGVQDPSTPLPPSSGQLVSFNRFKSKDPFEQQVTDCGTQACAATVARSDSGATASGGSASGSGATSGTGTGFSAGTGARPSATASSASPRKPTTATISVNGSAQAVAVGKTFPAADPVFVLVSVTAKQAMIGISGGSLENGRNAVALRVGRTVTLQNTADGARYVLKLLRTA
jgi:hypothetical protein